LATDAHTILRAISHPRIAMIASTGEFSQVVGRVGRMAIAAVLKTAVRKDFWVRIPGPP
jgi:hypothetical protein